MKEDVSSKVKKASDYKQIEVIKPYGNDEIFRGELISTCPNCNHTLKQPLIMNIKTRFVKE